MPRLTTTKLSRPDAPQFRLSDPIESDFLGEAAHIRHVHDHTGARVASLKLVPRGDTLHVAWFGRPPSAPGRDANALGPAHVREIGRVVKAAYPETKRVTGERISGFRSRAGLSDVHTSVKLARKRDPLVFKNHTATFRALLDGVRRERIRARLGADRTNRPEPGEHVPANAQRVLADYIDEHFGSGDEHPIAEVLRNGVRHWGSFYDPRASVPESGHTPWPSYGHYADANAPRAHEAAAPRASGWYKSPAGLKLHFGRAPGGGAIVPYVSLTLHDDEYGQMMFAMPFRDGDHAHEFAARLPEKNRKGEAVRDTWRRELEKRGFTGSETPVKLSRVGRWLGGLISSFRDELHESLGRHGMTPSEAAAHRARIVSKVRAEEAAKDAKLRAKHEAGAKWLAETSARVKAFADKHHERFARTFNIADKAEAHKKLSGLLNHAIDTGLRGRGKFTGRTQPSGLDAGGGKAEFRVNIRQAPPVVKNSAGFAGGTNTHVPLLVKKPQVKLARPNHSAYTPLLHPLVYAPHSTTDAQRGAFADFLEENNFPGAHVARGHMPEAGIIERLVRGNREHIRTGADVVLDPEIDIHEVVRKHRLFGDPPGMPDRAVHRGRITMDDDRFNHGDLSKENGYAPTAVLRTASAPKRGVTVRVRHYHPSGNSVGFEAHAPTREEFEHLISDFPPQAQEHLRAQVGHWETYLGAPVFVKHRRKKKLARQRFAGEGASVAATTSANHEARLKVANQILRESGLTPAEVRAAILHAGGSTRPALAAIVQRDAHPDHVRYTAAWLGLATQQPAVAVATVDPNGRDTLHVISGAGDHAGLASALKRAGVEKFTVEQKPTGHRIFVLNPDGKYPVAQIAKANNARHSAARVSVTRLGSGASADATGGTAADAKSRAAYREAIDAFERAGASEA
jgi:hypothetical protein